MTVIFAANDEWIPTWHVKQDAVTMTEFQISCAGGRKLLTESTIYRANDIRYKDKHKNGKRVGEIYCTKITKASHLIPFEQCESLLQNYEPEQGRWPNQWQVKKMWKQSNCHSFSIKVRNFIPNACFLQKPSKFHVITTKYTPFLMSDSKSRAPDSDFPHPKHIATREDKLSELHVYIHGTWNLNGTMSNLVF